MTRELSSASSLLGRAVALAIIASGFTTTAVAQSSETSVEFNMPAQSLDQALRNYGVVADKQVMFSVDLVNGKTVGPIAGEMTADEALQTLLADTGLTFETTTSDVILIRTAQWDSSVTGRNSLQTVRFQDVAPRQIESVDEKDDDGGFVVSEDEGDVFQQLEEIIVTGTNIRGTENPTAPVLSFDRQDIDVTGAATVEDFLRTIPQNFSNLDSSASLLSANPDTNANGTLGSSVNLRGVGLGATLTLLNGRRLPNATGAQGNFVDTSAIPVDALNRIDVQSDGASAIYGSDAVAGVVNFITRQDYEGFEARGRYGFVEGGGEQFNLGASGGVTWKTGGAFLSTDYGERQPLTNSDRDFIDPTIALPEATLLNENETLNLIGSFNQELTSKLVARVDALYSSRDTVSFGPLAAGSQTLISRRAEVEALAINTRVDYLFSENLVASLFYDYADESSIQLQTSSPTATPFEQKSDLSTVELQISGSPFKGSGDDVSFAAGVLYREEALAVIDDPESATLNDAERDVTAVYVEVLAPIFSEENSVPLIQSFDISLAGRYEDYSDFGDNFTPKIGLHWRLNDEVALRGTYSESFRAPTLNSLSANRDVNVINAFPTFFVPGSDALSPDPRLSPGTVSVLTVGGASGLTEETAEIWSGGIEYEPSWLDGLRLEVNYFDIAYTDRIETVTAFTALFDPTFSSVLLVLEPDVSLVAPFLDDPNLTNVLPFTPSAEDIQVFLGPLTTNLSSRDVSGVDLIASYRATTPVGDLSTSLNLTHLIAYDAQLTPTSPTVEEVGTLYRPSELRLRGTASLSRDGFTAFAAVNYTDDYQDLADTASATPIDSWTTLDLSLAYDTSKRFGGTWADNTQLSIAVQNLFNEDPPCIETPLDGLNFDPANANGLGRVITLQLRRTF